ncbi:MAG: ArsR family transcriptional regulator [Opitutales bacterium]|nr:ArsR family transcriptional regulator [Opitutales bacterium]
MSDSDTSEVVKIEPWEQEMIVLFTSAANMFGFRKSVGTIYGYLFCREEPLNLETLMQRLRMSKGTVSQGLSFLRKAGAVKLTFVPGDRREHFQPELSLKKLVAGFLRDQVYPHMESGGERIDHIEEVIHQEKGGPSKIMLERLKSLRSWEKQAKLLLPIIQKFLSAGKS